jgi:hypothetical protein
MLSLRIEQRPVQGCQRHNITMEKVYITDMGSICLDEETGSKQYIFTVTYENIHLYINMCSYKQ